MTSADGDRTEMSGFGQRAGGSSWLGHLVVLGRTRGGGGGRRLGGRGGVGAGGAAAGGGAAKLEGGGLSHGSTGGAAGRGAANPGPLPRRTISCSLASRQVDVFW